VLAGASSIGSHARYPGDDDLYRLLLTYDSATGGFQCGVRLVRVGEYTVGARPRGLRGLGVHTAAPDRRRWQDVAGRRRSTGSDG